MVFGALVVCGVIDPCDKKYRKAFEDLVEKSKKLASNAHEEATDTYDKWRSDVTG
jgi:hypothetical protein